MSDRYIDYPFEEVMFRVASETGEVYMKFYEGTEGSRPVSKDHRLYREALQDGREIPSAEYFQGRPAKMRNDI